MIMMNQTEAQTKNGCFFYWLGPEGLPLAPPTAEEECKNGPKAHARQPDKQKKKKKKGSYQPAASWLLLPLMGPAPYD